MSADEEIVKFKNKENRDTNVRKKTKKTTKEQYAIMQKFVSNNNVGTFGKQKFSEMWDDVATELNKIGPPTHPSAIWRKIWTNYTYDQSNRNAKRRKLNEMNTSDTDKSESSEDDIFDSYFESTNTKVSGMNYSVSGATSNKIDRSSTSNLNQLSEAMDGNVVISQSSSNRNETNIEGSSTSSITHLDSLES